MDFKVKNVAKIIITVSICLAVVIGTSKESKAETTGQINKVIVLKTSNLKVNKTIVENGTIEVLSEKPDTGISRGSSSLSSQIVSNAYAQLGSPYFWGASGPEAFDCSGLITYIYGSSGIYLPRTSSSQYYSGTNISMEELVECDLVFFDTYESLSHVGIYIGGGDFIHAGNNGVVVSSLYEGYYSSRYSGATRVL